MVGQYRIEIKYHTNGRENTRKKVSITLMAGKYRNENKFNTNGRQIQERK